MANQPLKKYLPLVIREMQFKPTVRYNQFTHIRKAKKKKKTNTQRAVSAGEGAAPPAFTLVLSVGARQKVGWCPAEGQPSWRTVCQCLRTLLLGITREKWKQMPAQQTYTWAFAAFLSITAADWKQPGWHRRQNRLQNWGAFAGRACSVWNEKSHWYTEWYRWISQLCKVKNQTHRSSRCMTLFMWKSRKTNLIYGNQSWAAVASWGVGGGSWCCPE